ncbi:helicase-like protein [Solirubrobacter pauli]|uniref:Helicase-like protein n=1 Tax=Solirubrobacter pauli TaxID=166793 RepID=A0A660L8Y6_9ACTN|nr:DEAD/DEAH box helicase [Solirubrobacter pauli]RKQ90846.1 helicase-like protein [Solirubrobacter pauli]
MSTLIDAWAHASPSERERLAERALGTDAGRQLARCFGNAGAPIQDLRADALFELAANRPIDPNDASAWIDSDAHAAAVLCRHGITDIRPTRFQLHAIRQLAAGQAEQDVRAGLDWSRVHVDRLDEQLQQAHAQLPIELDDPAVWVSPADRRRAVARRLGLNAAVADELSRWALAHLERFDAADLRSWRIASPSWLALADEQLPAVSSVERPVGVFLAPAPGGSWELTPTFSLDAIRSLAALGAAVDRDLRAASLPTDAVPDLIAGWNLRTLHAGPRENVDSGRALIEALSRELGLPITAAIPEHPVDRWGRVLIRRASHTAADGSELQLRVVTFPSRKLPRRRVGSAPLDDHHAIHSAAMELGEAVQTAIERGLPLLLPSEASGELKDTVRVGRMKGRPGLLAITTADGPIATTRRVVAEQVLPELRALKRSGATVTLDAGARQLARMVAVQPLADDSVLLGRQRELAALKVVGSGVDASQTGTGKTITSGRALAHRAATTARFRGMVVAEGRLLGQWRDELLSGAPARGLAPLAPNLDVLIVADHGPIAGRLRRFDRELGERPGVVLVANGVLDRHPGELAALNWHLLIADEALRYANPATEAHQALAQLRMASVADCWLLTATPRGKDSEQLDVLVGLALGDEAMIRERLNTREAGDLLDELNAHRLRVNYGPHLVRVTRQDMQAWMPDVRPAQPLTLEADTALTELLDAIRQGGREAYRRLLELLRELRELEPGSPIYKQALAEIARVQGVVLGNVGVYVDASVDPETLTHSKAALAQGLCRQGLVAEAMRGGGDGLPLLRGVTAQTLAGIAGEEQVLVFAERVRCLRQLASTLRNRHGVEAHVADGSLTGRDFEALKHRFTGGEFPILCLSRVGQEGHNLQNASVLCHLDLPWLPSGLEQRVGRAARPGAVRGWVQTYIPYIRDAGIAHIVSILSPRGGEHHQVLDSYEGVAAADSTVATQLGQITGEIAEHKDQAGYAGTAAKLRVAASVFGAA